MIILKFKRALFACALVAGIAGISATSAQAVVVNAFTNSSSGGLLFSRPGPANLSSAECAMIARSAAIA